MMLATNNKEEKLYAKNLRGENFTSNNANLKNTYTFYAMSNKVKAQKRLHKE